MNNIMARENFFYPEKIGLEAVHVRSSGAMD